MVEITSCALVLLAAGASQRMGRPKQLLPVGDRALLRHVAEAAVDSGIGRVIVVLGAKAEEIRACLDGLPVQVVVNAEWEEGMGSSVRAGISALDSQPTMMSGVVIALADQPGFSANHVRRLLEAQHVTGKTMVASQSGGHLTPPVFFAPVHFPSLRTMRGDAGARALLQAHRQEVAVVQIDELGDIDTEDDYLQFLKRRPIA